MNNPLDLNIDVKDVSTAMPRLAENEYICSIKSATVEENKAKTGNNLVVVFATTEEAEDQNGEPLGAGIQVRKYYPLQQSSNERAPDFRRDLTILVDAAFNIDEAHNRPTITNETLAQLVGEEVSVRVRLRESDQYGLQNEIARISAIG